MFWFWVINHPYHSRSFFKFDVSCSFAKNKLYCIRHPSGLRSLVKLLSRDPFCLSADQKIFGAMPCPNDILQTSWLLAILLVAHGMGSKDVDNFMYVYGTACQSVLWFPHPLFLVHRSIILYENNFSGIKETLSFMI